MIPQQHNLHHISSLFLFLHCPPLLLGLMGRDRWVGACAPLQTAMIVFCTTGRGTGAVDWMWIAGGTTGQISKKKKKKSGGYGGGLDFACWTVLTPVSPPLLEAGPDPSTLSVALVGRNEERRCDNGSNKSPPPSPPSLSVITARPGRQHDGAHTLHLVLWRQ